MKSSLLYITLIVLVACAVGSHLEKKQEAITKYQVTLHGSEEFPLFVETIDKMVKIYAPTAAPQNSPLMISETSGDPKVLFGQFDEDGKLWKFGPSDATTVYGVSFAPYYSYYAYNMIQSLRNSGYEQLNPNCDVDTKFLIVFFMSEYKSPFAGCVK